MEIRILDGCNDVRILSVNEINANGTATTFADVLDMPELQAMFVDTDNADDLADGLEAVHHNGQKVSMLRVMTTPVNDGDEMYFDLEFDETEGQQAVDDEDEDEEAEEPAAPQIPDGTVGTVKVMTVGGLSHADIENHHNVSTVYQVVVNETTARAIGITVQDLEHMQDMMRANATAPAVAIAPEARKTTVVPNGATLVLTAKVAFKDANK